MKKCLLQIHNLEVMFPSLGNNVFAIRNCSLEVERGSIMGLVGESGSGKSVTSLAIMGLLAKHTDISGSILLNDTEIVGKSDEELRALRGSQVAMIFQNPMTALSPFFRVGHQIVDAICSKGNLNREEGRKLALSAFRDVYLPDPNILFDKYPHQMSGGQLQRVMIAMAIACKPDLLIADEPTTALDVTVQAQIILLLRDLSVKKNLSILFITHDLSVVASLCDHVAVMYAGQVVETGTVTQVLNDPAHPYTQKLTQAVPKIGAMDGELRFVPGSVPDLSLIQTGCSFSNRCDLALEECKIENPIMKCSENYHKVRCLRADPSVYKDDIHTEIMA
jgi:oligopeptide/dipeptide ABC transporter ATP-binding protein